MLTSIHVQYLHQNTSLTWHTIISSHSVITSDNYVFLTNILLLCSSDYDLMWTTHHSVGLKNVYIREFVWIPLSSLKSSPLPPSPPLVILRPEISYRQILYLHIWLFPWKHATHASPLHTPVTLYSETHKVKGQCQLKVVSFPWESFEVDTHSYRDQGMTLQQAGLDRLWKDQWII